ncbi:UDP-N-acetylmuramate--L-alanine ligase [bacterium]|nr:UDP-N-acetylmuramate--L-alanine ligase [bacterium]
MDARQGRSGSFAPLDVKARRRALLARLARPAGEEPLHVFCSGIGGTGLSGLASLARALGHRVSGSDQKASATTAALEARGVRVFHEQRGENLEPGTDLLVATAALPATHPELEAAVARSIPVVKYAEALGALVAARRGIAISGTHGKSTTTALVSHILKESGKDPTWIVGGRVPQLGGSAALGSGPDIVIEACEFDRSFLNYVPSTAVILNVEEDHLDCYGGGLPEIVLAFVAFGVGLREGGTLVVSADWPSALRVGELVKEARPDVFLSTFSVERDAHYRATNVSFEDGMASFDLLVAGERVARARLGIPGIHNVANALAAIAAVARAGVDPRVAALALPTFRGVSRRFEVLSHEPVVIVDDYAHHPTAVAAVVKAARVRFPARRIVACFEPHQASRTRHLFSEFADALALADRVVLADIYICRDSKEDVASVTAESLARAVRERKPLTEAVHARGKDGMVAAARRLAREGDVVVFMGAGTLATGAAHELAVLAGRQGVFRGAGAADTDDNETDDESDHDDDHDRDRSPKAESAAFEARVRMPVLRGVVALRPVSSLDLELEHSLGGMLTRNAPLASRLSFRAGGAARFLVEPRTAEEAELAFLVLRSRGVPVFVLGGGSNTLAKDGTWDGAVVATRKLEGIEVRGTTLRALAGTPLQRCTRIAEENDLAGLELFAGIPGTIGGAVCGNAGGPRNAGTVGERVLRCRVVDREGRSRWLGREELRLRYRGSDLEGTILLEVELSLARERRESVRARRFDAARAKAAHQPLDARSAGCIFRNPAGDSAGRVIDELGLKNRSRGAARVSAKHANFIVNDGGARAEEILGLVEDVRSLVRAKKGYEHELELRILGES